jgi:hypothetical protein
MVDYGPAPRGPSQTPNSPPQRPVADQEGERAQKMENPGMRGPIENTAKRAAALAEKLEAARKKG